ncbi:tetratricopeptide repeat protein [Dactylosporangium sp. CS-047395]|uniref:tetratricopeptide repeat protein n=1 Tax=Dactylosporangium sp. CS-047395 TaxID=3239936 RepID=UPI003D8E01CE
MKRATLSDAFNGRTLLGEQALMSLLTLYEEPESRRQLWLAAHQRIKARERGAAQRAAGTDRFDTVSPRDLGIHSAVLTPDALDELPAYVERDFDFRLRAALTSVVERGSFVVLVGGSSTGKTRSLYEAIHDVAPNWFLVQPEQTEELLELRHDPPLRTIFWLDELQRYLGGHPPLSADCVRALTRKPNIVVGTLWPDHYDARLMGGQSDPADDVRRLLRSALVISVADDFTTAERERAHEKAEEDPRLRIALDTRDAGVTQVLAGGPALVLHWEQARPYAKAMINAVADAHRLGVQSPLREDLLVEAMAGYLSGNRRVQPPEQWLAEAVPYVTQKLHGEVSALDVSDGGKPHTFAGYTIADYLAQHLRRQRRAEPIPDEAWRALVTRTGHQADLRRIADSATARMRYVYAEQALVRLATELGDGAAALELARLLVRQDRFDRAIEVLHRRLATDPRDGAAAECLAGIEALRRRVDELRPAATGDPAARRRLAEILDDGGRRDALRIRADAGEAVAAEELVEELASHGCLRELRERADAGHAYAAEALADLHVAWGDEEELRARAELGDEAAERRLPKVHEAVSRSGGAASELATLRATAGADPEAAWQLCGLLFELRDLEGLHNELDAGTYGAADRLMALHTAGETMPIEQLMRLRAFGLTADGAPIDPPADFRKDPRWPS